ncbi:MAG TPA: selenocysteine-specific translation elongation factor [Candidatus Deferrimicrobium sp.]|nr:selenocysteine-specific translation elongation factor [Candidatus Deferrimicrobium sp.]
MIQKKIPIHIGLFGHIDHGKTALAARLSEKISTAGLDKHPQAQERGITIDIGFTAFDLNEYFAILVDAPGHADLISNVVAAANIIDVAILVIAADEGPMIQTGEHILILENFGVNFIIALNKVDLVDRKKLEETTGKIKGILKSRFEGIKIVPISAKTGEGMKELKEALYSIVNPPVRKTEGPFKMPIDHAFPIKGAGTVLTGTIYRGKIMVGDTIEITPLGLSGKVRTIQSFKENLITAIAGDRVGVAIPGIDAQKIFRGCYAAAPGTLIKTNKILIKGKVINLFKGVLKPKMQVHVTVAMPTVSGTIYPFEPAGQSYKIIEEVNPGEIFFAAILLNEFIAAEAGDPVIISRLDLPPTTLRIVGNGVIVNPVAEIELVRERQKIGTVRVPVHKRGSIVDGLVQSKEGAQKVIGEQVITASGIEGKIISPFGTKSALIIQFSEPPKENEEVFLKRFRKFKL